MDEVYGTTLKEGELKNEVCQAVLEKSGRILLAEEEGVYVNSSKSREKQVKLEKEK